MTSNQYQCWKCKGVFEKGWSDEEAEAERAANWPRFSQDDCDVVCDDCYKAFMSWFTEQKK